MGKRGRKGVGLSSSQRTKLRRLVAKGKLVIPHKWGDAWPMTPEIREALGMRSVVDIAEEEHAREANDPDGQNAEGSNDEPIDAARPKRAKASGRRARPVLVH